jgi:hypothetical protein
MSERAFTAAERELSARKIREARQRKAEEAAEVVDRLVAEDGAVMPSWAKAHATKARKGNVRSLVALKCGECSAWSRAEIACCSVRSCPLHSIRPYKETP